MGNLSGRQGKDKDNKINEEINDTRDAHHDMYVVYDNLSHNYLYL